MKNGIDLYSDSAGKIRWRAVADENGEILADSGQGYVHENDALGGFARVAAMGLSDVEVRSFNSLEEANAKGSHGISRLDFGITPLFRFKDMLNEFGVEFEEYTEDDGTKSVTVTPQPETNQHWIGLNFEATGEFKTLF